MAGSRAGPYTAVYALAVLSAIILAAVVLLRMDISAARDFRSDTIVVDAFGAESLTPRRFFDPSPYTIWLPSDWFVHDSVRSGHLPLWEPMQGGGYSPLVGGQGGVFHPLRLLASALPREAMPSALITAALALGGIGVFLFCVESGLSTSAAIVGACLFALSSAVVSYAEFSGGLQPLIHLPWIVWAYRRALARRTRLSFLLLAVLFALMFSAGHPLIATTVCAAAASLACADALATRRVMPVLLVAGAAVAGAALAAPSLLPPLFAVPDSWTYKLTDPSGRPYSAYPFEVWLRLIGATVVDQYRSTCCIDLPLFFVYIGPSAMALAGAATFVAKREAVASRRVLLLALGWFAIAVPGPWMAPVAGLFTFWKPWYLHGAFAFFFAAAAAHGFERLMSEKRVWRYVAMALAAVAVTNASARAFRVFDPHRWQPIVGGDVVAALRADHELYRISGLPGAVQVPNDARVTGIADVRLAAPVFSRRFRLWWLLVDPAIDARSYPTAPMTDDLRSPLVGDFNIKYVLQSRVPRTGWFHSRYPGPQDRELSPLLVPPHFPLLKRTAAIELHRVADGVRPRVHFAERVVAVPDLDSAARLLAADRDLVARASVVESESLPRNFPTVARGSATVTYPHGAGVSIDTNSDTGGLVVLHDAFAPGWTATIDGRATDILPVNVLSRGVFSPAGRHHIEMAYVPPGLGAGVAISAVTLLGIVALIIVEPKVATPAVGASTSPI